MSVILYGTILFLVTGIFIKILFYIYLSHDAVKNRITYIGQEIDIYQNMFIHLLFLLLKIKTSNFWSDSLFLKLPVNYLYDSIPFPKNFWSANFELKFTLSFDIPTEIIRLHWSSFCTFIPISVAMNFLVYCSTSSKDCSVYTDILQTVMINVLCGKRKIYN